MAEVKKVHETGQPILIGTGSVEESECLAAELGKAGVSCHVLNARNDEMEAGIIARAGEPGAVTVSTNMAGRGVDIKLGGEREQERERVVASGGLYVMGANRHESRRIDNQLRGRAGRQWDPGESRFFVSLEDDLVKKYELDRLIPSRNKLERQAAAVDDPVVRSELARGQRIVEGYNSDLRIKLLRYSFLIEQQRRIIHGKRQDILMDKAPLQLLAARAAKHYSVLRSRVGAEVLRKIEKQITLYYLPSSTWTYVVSDNQDHLSNLLSMMKVVKNAISGPIFILQSIYKRVFQRKEV